MKKFVILILCMALVAVCLPALAAGGGGIELNVAAGKTYGFSENDFGAVAGEDLRGVIVMSLPESGVLEYGSREILKGEGVLATGLSGLRYTPEGEGVSSFSVLPVYWSGGEAEAVTVSITASPSVDAAPTAEDVELTTYKNTPAGAAFIAADPEGGELTYRVVSKSARGSVSVDGGLFVYTPYEGKTGKDSFTYVAVDEAGNVSNEAKVSVRIEKQAKVTYSDMEGDAAGASAIRLAEAGVYTGAEVGGEYVFGGAELITRGEFVALAVCAAGLEGTDVSLTGFTDDAGIPTWLRPYVATAVVAGAVSGFPGENGVSFGAGEALTGAQAAVITASLLGAEGDAIAVFGEESVPVWAAAAVSGLAGEGALPAGFSLSEPVTRSEAAMLLCSILDA